MLTERFNTLFTGLSDAFVSYDDTPRGADAVLVLARARADLEDARYAINLERRLLIQGGLPKPSAMGPSPTQVSPVFSFNHER